MLRWLAVFLLVWTPIQIQAQEQEVFNEHQLRVRNHYDRGIEKLQIGSLIFQAIAPRESSGYSVISVGQFKVVGNLEGKGNIYLDGTLVIPQAAPQPWTLTLNPDRSFSIASDLPPGTTEAGSGGQRVVKNPLPTPLRSRLRFQNWFGGRVNEARIGEISYQDIPSGGTTRYTWVTPGVLDVGVDLQGFGAESVRERVYIPGEAHRRYTLRLTEQGTLLLIQDP